MELIYIVFILAIALKFNRADSKRDIGALEVGSNPTLRKYPDAFTKRYNKMMNKFGPIKGTY